MWGALAGLLTLVAAALGYAAGSAKASVHLAVGRAYSTRYQIGVTTGGWSYGIPLDVPWRASDDHGAWHYDRSRPECLPVSDRLQPVKFGWVPVQTPDHIGTRVVVWVDCR